LNGCTKFHCVIINVVVTWKDSQLVPILGLITVTLHKDMWYLIPYSIISLVQISKLNWFFVGDDMSRLYLKDFSIQLQGINAYA
jgi:hypothetical protein